MNFFHVVDHKALVDEKKASPDGKDLRVFYHSDKDSLPYEIDRVVTGLHTTEARIQFRIQKMIPSNTVDRSSYALVFAGGKAGKAKSDPKKSIRFLRGFFKLEVEPVDSGVGRVDCQEWCCVWQNGRVNLRKR